MRICLLCTHGRVAQADEMLRNGATQAGVARLMGLDKQVVGKHVRNGHVKPAPQQRLVWQWSADEIRVMKRVDDEFLAVTAAVSGLTKAQLRRCNGDVLPADHPDGCPACAALETCEPMWSAINERVTLAMKPEPGAWVPA